MGVAYGDIKKKRKNNLNQMVPDKKVNRNIIKRRVTTKNECKIIKNFKNDNIIIESKSQSKTDKKIEESTNKANIIPLKSMKCLSYEHLVKIEGGHSFPEKNNQEEACPNSVETNFSSNRSNEEIVKTLLAEDTFNGIDDNNNDIEEDDNESEDNEEEEKENEENDETKNEDKLNNYIITNNIKTVFVDSKMQGKEPNDIHIVNNENLEKIDNNSTPSSTFDYELNIYKSGNEIRQSYISKLITKNIWNPSMKPKQHNSIIIYDWDDTLLPTSFITPNGVFDEEMTLSESDKEKFLKIEQCVFLLLTESIEKGNVYIITNAGKGWVEYSAKRFYPSIIELLPKIEIISARGEYEKLYPGNSRQWKIQAFLNLLKNVNIKLVTNIICIGDSLFEMEAGRILASKFTEAFIKTIKFREAPKLDELIKQLKLVCLQFGSIYSSIKNLTIRVEKKRKEEI